MTYQSSKPSHVKPLPLPFFRRKTSLAPTISHKEGEKVAELEGMLDFVCILYEFCSLKKILV